MNYFLSQLDYVFFFYGASFIILGAVCFAILRHSYDMKKMPCLWLGLFGFIHGLHEWMDMAAISLGDNTVFSVFRLVVFIASFICLLEFDRRAHFEITGRRVSLSIYVWLFIFASTGLSFGAKGMFVLSRYSFGLVSTFWASYILLSFNGSKDRPLNRFSLNYLRLAGVIMLLYGLSTGFVVPAASFFPANFINAEKFISFAHIPVQLVRAVFAFVMAASMSIYAINYSTEAFFVEAPNRKKHFINSLMSLILVLVLAIFYFGWLAVENYGQRVYNEETGSRRLKAKVYSQFVQRVIKKLEVFEAFSRSPEVIANLSVDISKINFEAINERLDRYKSALEADVCYLMDETGMTIASSNRNSPKSFVGKDYSFRPYFQEAMKGAHSVYLAKGVTSKERGIYASFPVYDEKRERVLGVAAAKATTDSLSQYFMAYKYIMLVSKEGIIFVSSKPDWIFRSIRDLTFGEKEKLRSTRQFGDGPWDNVGFENEDDATETIYFRGSRFYFVKSDIEGLPGWHVYFLDDRSNVAVVRFMMILIFLSFFLLITIITLFIFRISLDALHLSASEAVYEALVEGSPDSISLFAKDARCISINKSGLLVMGWDKKDVIGKLFDELWPQEHRKKVSAAVQGVLEGHQQSFEATMYKSDGEMVIKSVILAPILEHSGNIKYFISISRDITEERRSRERLLDSSKMSTIGALATGVSHEFNNVLEIILGNAEIAYASRDNDTMKKSLKVIIESARRAAWIIKSMLDFSGNVSEVREFVDLADLVKQNLLLLNKVFEANEITVETHFAQVPRVYCNAGQLSQAFVNIMMNARDAMRGLDRKKLVVRIDYLVSTAEAAVSFQDSGMGINENIKNKLFGPFVTTKGVLGGGEDKQPGVGLGLFIAYGIVKQHNGNISVESEEGKGSKFTIYLPIFSAKEEREK